jgi:mannose-6-phosphate isomerase-like protein (cupin superfamily)
MKKFCVPALILILLLPARSEDSPPTGFDHWRAATLQSLAHALSSEASSDPHHFAVRQLGDFPNDSFLLVHRETDGSPELHETQVDAIWVISGSATLVVGGKLINGETVAPHEKRNGTIEGGARQKLSAGDVVRIPPNTPHQLLLEGGHEFTYFVVKVKGY